MPLSPGKLRNLQQISTANGIFAILAADHRDPLIELLEKRDGKQPLAPAVTAEKLRLTGALAPHASAVLLDPIFSVEPAIVAGVLPGNVGLLVAREKSGYATRTDAISRTTTLLPDWDASAIKRIGGNAVKMLLYYHPDAPNAAEQETIVRQVAEECRQADIPFLLEPICYPLQKGQRKTDPDFAAQRPEIVIESARRLVPLGVDVLKAEFPTAPTETDAAKMADYCRQLTESIGIPWVLLSAGVDFPTFQHQLEIACDAGASGFTIGRSVWQEAVSLPTVETRRRALNTIAVSRFRILADIAVYRAAPWQTRFPKDAVPGA